jgi:pyruvate/2-oxoacid:ferredoxin oxidoreductase alpha subunit
VTAREFLDAFAAELGVDAPDEATVEQLLALAAEAAHASERTAAPIVCWLAARAGATPGAALAAAQRLASSPAS